MALNNVYVKYSSSGLGSPAVGEDFISGMIFYTSAYPSGFSQSAQTADILSLSQAESLGITNTSIGEIRASGTTTITGSGNTGNIATIIVSTLVFGNVTLGAYAVAAADTTTLIATGLAASINAGTLTHGFFATSLNAVVTVVAPVQTGVANGFVFANTVTGTVTLSNSAFAGGVASWCDPIHYHISEYFRSNPTGEIWTMFSTTGSSTSQYSEVVSLVNTSAGKIRQVGIYEEIAFATANLGLIQTQITACVANNKPISAFYQADFSSVTNLTSLTDLTTLSAPNVTTCIGQDGGNINLGGGYRLWMARNKSVGSMGLNLGATSFANVNENTAWVGKFNMDNGAEMDTLAFANGALYSAQSDNLITQIDSKAYTFLRKFVGIGGSYFNNNNTCITPTSDYSNVSNNRVIQKASREVRSRLLPLVASPVYFNPDGTIALYSIAHFKNECDIALGFMISAGEISQFKTIINPRQNILSTKNLAVTIQIIPSGNSDIITVSLGFVLNF
jgi:hypothetical protein